MNALTISRLIQSVFWPCSHAFNGLTGGTFRAPFCARVYHQAMLDPCGPWDLLREHIDAIFPENEHCRQTYIQAKRRGVY